jgi:hypothetical protein
MPFEDEDEAGSVAKLKSSPTPLAWRDIR